jgi:hypothetical protein
MDVLFLSTLEKRAEDERVKTAQVTVAEDHGSWHVMWSEPGEKDQQQEIWYEGPRWDEMMTVFRRKLHEKQSQGYRPMLDALGADPFDFLGERYAQSLMLQHYSESAANDELYEKLRVWRREQSAKEGKSPFILSSNKVLKMISAYVPQRPDELSQIPGLGQQRAAAYGGAILAITQGFEQPRPFPLSWVESETDRTGFVLWIQKQKEQKRDAERSKAELKHRILELVSGGLTLIELEEQLKQPRKELLEWIEELDKMGYDMESIVAAELTSVPETKRQMAWQALEKLGDKYLKPVLEAVYEQAEERPKGKALDAAYEWLRLLRLQFRKQRSESAAVG